MEEAMCLLKKKSSMLEAEGPSPMLPDRIELGFKRNTAYHSGISNMSYITIVQDRSIK
jgi:hypothetical protein